MMGVNIVARLLGLDNSEKKQEEPIQFEENKVELQNDKPKIDSQPNKNYMKGDRKEIDGDEE